MNLRSTLHQRGMRMTPQRQLVLDAVRELEHATPDEICARVQRIAPTINITTVYRTLELLSDLGLVRHTHLGHGAPVYSPHDHEHLHLVCHRCGSVVEGPRELLDGVCAEARERWGFELDAGHLALTGHCADCAADTRLADAAAAVAAGIDTAGTAATVGAARIDTARTDAAAAAGRKEDAR